MKPKELTARGLILGVLLTLVFTAAYVYLGLKVGLTFASSIPAAVISMAILARVRDSSILENNIVQTVASAAGTLSAIIFVLPGLVIVGWWAGVPFWQTFLVCTAGVVLGSVASAGLAILTGTRIAAAELTGFFRLGGWASTGYNIAWSLALLGAGHLVGLSVGMAMLVGQIISWVIAVPWLTTIQPVAAGGDLAAHTINIWRTQVRFIGAGAIGVAAIYTLARLAKPVAGGLVSTLAASRAVATNDERDRDMSAGWILGLTAACIVVSGLLAWAFARSTPALAPNAATVTLIAIPFVLLVGFLIAGVCGYMAGLIGASNSPISGVGILSIVICASLLGIAIAPTDATRPALVAFALFVTSIVFACATISNDNLQDLKTGQLVGASPRKQQIALIVGVAAGAAVIAPVLNLLARAYGFAGAPNIDVVSQTPLPAPQATLISALAVGVIGGNLEWGMIGIGALVGVGLILLDEAMRRAGRLRIPPRAVGIGIYLPMSATFAVIVGAVISHWYDRRVRSTPNPERAERLGTLVASGLIVGESLWGVLNAGLIVALANDAPIALVPGDFALAPWLGVLGFVGAIVWLYGWMLRRARAAGVTPV